MNATLWEQMYLEGRTGWDRGRPSPALDVWGEDLRKAETVLIPACGHGYEVEALVRAGVRVTAVDLAATPLRRLRTRLDAVDLDAELIQADLLAWEPAAPFAAVYEQTALCALPPDRWPDYGDRLWRWLAPGGTLFALFMQTGREGGPPYHCALEAMRLLFPASRWRWLDAEPLVLTHPSGLRELGLRLHRLPWD